MMPNFSGKNQNMIEGGASGKTRNSIVRSSYSLVSLPDCLLSNHRTQGWSLTAGRGKGVPITRKFSTQKVSSPQQPAQQQRQGRHCNDTVSVTDLIGPSSMMRYIETETELVTRASESMGLSSRV